MAYCRFGFDHSDVYVYEHVGGYLTCAGCLFDSKREFTTHSRMRMLDHLYEHRKAGQVVPEGAMDRLADEFRVIGDEVGVEEI